MISQPRFSHSRASFETIEAIQRGCLPRSITPTAEKLRRYEPDFDVIMTDRVNHVIEAKILEDLNLPNK